MSVACELNLVSDAVVIGNKYNDNIEMMNNTYTSEDGTTHRLFELSSDLAAELGCRGSLGDRARDGEFCEIRKFFNSQCGHRYARVGEMTPFVLDFDLDYFTLDTKEGTMAWTQRIWKKHFDLGKPGATFINDLIGKAMVITVCREPDYCGGIAGSNYNLQNLDNYLFDGQLGTNLLY